MHKLIESSDPDQVASHEVRAHYTQRLVLATAVCQELKHADGEIVGRPEAALEVLAWWMRTACNLPEGQDVTFNYGLDDPRLTKYASDLKAELFASAGVCSAMATAFTADKGLGVEERYGAGPELPRRLPAHVRQVAAHDKTVRPEHGAGQGVVDHDDERGWSLVNLTAVQRDRAVGALLGMAAGDALGAPYEFGPPLGLEVEVAMAGGQGWEPGEWTDDTSMSIVIAQAAAAHGDLRSEAALDEIVVGWRRWAQDAKDVGLQTRHVLDAAHRDGLSARSARAAAAALHAETGRTAGNGSLMRTAPVALAYLDDEDALVEAARTVSELTHYDPDAGDACVLWSLAIQHAILTGDLDARVGLDRLPADRRDRWNHLLDVAEQSTPADFHDNGWVVEALQAAWSAITATSATPGDADDQHLPQAIEAAVRGGRDADTVAAIAGALLGAGYGASAVPELWRDALHGWPGMTWQELITVAEELCEVVP